MVSCSSIAVSFLLLSLHVLLVLEGSVVASISSVLWCPELRQRTRLLLAQRKLVRLHSCRGISTFMADVALLGTLYRIRRDQFVFALASGNGDNHALSPSQHQRLVAADGDEALLFAPGQVEAFGHRCRAGRILRFEDLDGGVGG